MEEHKFKIAYDVILHRPGCVLLQAVLGDREVAHLFPTETWLLAPTKDLKVYEVTKVQLQQLVTLTKQKAVL